MSGYALEAWRTLLQAIASCKLESKLEAKNFLSFSVLCIAHKLKANKYCCLVNDVVYYDVIRTVMT